MLIRATRSLFVLAAIVLPAAWLYAQTKASKPIKRAQPPKPEASGGPFFSDAFSQLVGERPADLSKAVASAGNGASSTPAGSATNGGGLSGSGWASVISSGTIEDEIKALKSKIDGEITTPTEFAGKGAKLARRDFTVMAMLFGVIGEYDGEVRFKAFGPSARDAFSRVAANAKSSGNENVYKEAKLRKGDLQEVIGGGNPFGGKDAEAKATWNQVCHRSPLMMHLEEIYEPKVKAWCADKGAFTSNSDKLLHEAEIIAAVASVLKKEGLEDATADDYKQWCEQMTKAGRTIADAVKQKNFEAASAAASEIGKARDSCHGTYR